MPHIFISYAKKDTRAFAEALLRELNALPGVTAWMDTSLQADSSWASQIEGEIDRADYVIVLLSPDVNRRETATQSRSFVLNEIDFAQQERKPILPVMVQRARMPLQLAGVQYIDLTATPNNPAQIIERVRQRFSIPVPPPPKPAAPVAATRALPEKTTRPFPVDTTAAAPRRSNVVPIVGAAFALFIIAAAISIIIPSLTARLTPTLAPGTLGSVAQAQQTQTMHAMETASDQSMNSIRVTDNALDTQDAATFAASTQAAENAALSTTSPLGFIPVTRNDDWTPVEQDFGGVAMVMVPAGCFQMGSDRDGIDGLNTTVPDGGTQCFDSPFWIDKLEVTNEQFLTFNGQSLSEARWTEDNLPREMITWFESRDFCARRGARLPTEREWEYAARGPDNLNYPWGQAFIASSLVYVENSPEQPNPVGPRLGGVSWVGAHDLSGNVSEWVSTIYGVSGLGTDEDTDFADSGELIYSYPYRPDDGREQDSDEAVYVRSLRGGSFRSTPLMYLRSASRGWSSPDSASMSVGFRCARSVTPPAPTLGG